MQTNNFTVNVNVASYFWVIDSVYYNTDWIAGIHEIFGIQPSGTDAFNASITVNFSEVPDGNHTLMVYANTHDGSHSFATVIFSTEMHSPNLSKTEPFPILIVLEISALVVVAVTSIGLLVFRIYRKKRNRKKKNNLTQQTFQGIQISTFRRRL